jgi:hypothetical protein
VVLVAGAAGALLLASCTEPAPEPSPAPPEPDEAVDEVQPPSSLRVEMVVVLPGADELAEEHAGRLGASIDELGAELGEARAPRAVLPDAEVFVGDLARTFADRGTPLVCVLGADAEAVVAPLLLRYPSTRFCVLPAVQDEPEEDATPDPVLRADVRAEELGHLAGLAARQHAGGGAVGLSLVGDELPSDRFRRGAFAGLDGIEVVELRGTGEERAAMVADLGLGTVLVDGGAANAELVAQLPSAVALVGPVGVTRQLSPPRRVLSWDVRWQLPLEWALARSARDGGATAASFGVSEDAFVLELGPALPPALAEVVDDARRELAAGTRDPLEPAPAPPGDDDADDDPDDDPTS